MSEPQAPEPEKKEPKRLTVELPRDLKAVYANMAFISQTPVEMVLDFAQAAATHAARLRCLARHYEPHARQDSTASVGPDCGDLRAAVRRDTPTPSPTAAESGR